jgi:6-pyruvoyl-tetrahydropterin synthase related domain
MVRVHKPTTRSLTSATTVIGAAAFCALVPCLWLGIPSGHDFEYHFNSWIEVLGQWRQGVVYPHWSALAHFGYGEARYIFYPPASWTLGAALGAILPWTLVSYAYNWIALTLAGLSMFVAARRWLPHRDALYAAVFYAVNPYHLVIVYWRSAMAELLAAAYLPLLFLYILRLDDDGPRAIAPFSLLVAAGWLTNIPTAVMMMYSVGLLTLWLAVSRKSWKVLGYACTAVILGLAVAAIYLLPVWHQRTWVALGQVLAPGVRPLENFLFYVTRDEDHNRFNRIVSVVALWEVVILAFSVGIARRKSAKELWWPLALWGAMSAILMIRWTVPLWNHLPELQYVQFPWRWLLCLNATLAIVLTFALQRWWLRVLVCAIAIGSVPMVWHRIQPPWWDKAPDLQEMADNQHEGIGNDGTDEYVPVAADSYDVDQNAPQAAYEGSGNAKIRIESWQPERRRVVADASAPGSLVLRLFNYPSWKVGVNGSIVHTDSTEHTGLMIVPVGAGENRVEIRFVEGWDRKVGALISALALASVIGLWLKSRRGSGVTEG